MLKGENNSTPFAYPLTRRELMLLAGTALAASLPGCTTGKQGARVSAQNTLRYPLPSPPTTLDPALVEDGTTIDLLQNIFEGLVILDEKSRTVPGIAERWEVSPDGTKYTFYLRKGVKFHNGREVHAADFVYSLDRACDPATNSQTVFSYLGDIVGVKERRNGTASAVKGIEAPDDYTLQITIDSPKSYWIDKMTYPTGYVVCREAIEKSGGKVDASSVIGAGPFKIAAPQDYSPQYQVLLTAFDDYHQGRPKLDHIERPVLLDPTTRLSKYEAGGLDLVEVSPSDIDHINSDPHLKPDLHLYPRAATWYLALNQDAPGSPFGDKRVRTAFNMAVDREEITRVALKNLMNPATGIVPPGMSGYQPHITLIPFDPQQARTLLAQAGYGTSKPFPTLALAFRNDYQWVADSAQVIAKQLSKNLGISVQLQPTDWGQLLQQLDSKALPFCLERWEADYLDPQDFLSVLLHTSRKVNGQWDHPENNTGYSNAQFDSLCSKADVEPDMQKRFALYAQAEQIAISDGPWVPVFYQTNVELDAPRVQGIRDSLLGHLPYTTTTVTG